MAMEQFEDVLVQTLLITVRLGIPVALFFLIGYMTRYFQRGKETKGR